MAEEELTASDLTDNELQALVALMRVMAGADGGISGGEAGVFQHVATDVGEARFRDATAAVAERMEKESDALEFAKLVTRPGAREFVYGTLYELAVPGTIVEKEGEVLAFLEKEWGLSVS